MQFYIVINSLQKLNGDDGNYGQKSSYRLYSIIKTKETRKIEK